VGRSGAIGINQPSVSSSLEGTGVPLRVRRWSLDSDSIADAGVVRTTITD